MNLIDLHLWQKAYNWLCMSRIKSGHNADIWDLRFKWPHEGNLIFFQINAGVYQLSPMRIIHSRYGEAVAQWSARDALVLKWVALKIKGRLPVQDVCAHVAGQRGGRTSLAMTAQAISGGARYVYRTDIRGYYRNINKSQLLNHLYRFIHEPALRSLLYQYVHYCVDDGGEIHLPARGISRGCALSPLIGASILWYMDVSFSERNDIFYSRYMDDFLFLSARRWPVRRAQKQLYEFFDSTGFECHPDKTQIGKISRGFDWLGIWFTSDGATGIAPRATENHRLRRLRLEEQARRSGRSRQETEMRVQMYERRWNIWAESQLSAANEKNNGLNTLQASNRSRRRKMDTNKMITAGILAATLHSTSVAAQCTVDVTSGLMWYRDTMNSILLPAAYDQNMYVDVGRSASWNPNVTVDNQLNYAARALFDYAVTRVAPPPVYEGEVRIAPAGYGKVVYDVGPHMKTGKSVLYVTQLHHPETTSYFNFRFPSTQLLSGSSARTRLVITDPTLCALLPDGKATSVRRSLGPGFATFPYANKTYLGFLVDLQVELMMTRHGTTWGMRVTPTYRDLGKGKVGSPLSAPISVGFTSDRPASIRYTFTYTSQTQGTEVVLIDGEPVPTTRTAKLEAATGAGQYDMREHMVSVTTQQAGRVSGNLTINAEIQ